MDAAWAEGYQPVTMYCQACGADTHEAEWMNETRAAEHMGGGVRPKTLANWRSLRTGPPSFKAEGGVVYARCLIDKWILTRE